MRILSMRRQTRVINKQINYRLLLALLRLRGKLLLHGFFRLLSLHQALQDETTGNSTTYTPLGDENHNQHETHANSDSNEHGTVVLLYASPLQTNGVLLITKLYRPFAKETASPL